MSLNSLKVLWINLRLHKITCEMDINVYLVKLLLQNYKMLDLLIFWWGKLFVYTKLSEKT